MNENTAPGRGGQPTSASDAAEGQMRPTGPSADRSEADHRAQPRSQSNRHRAWQFAFLLMLPVVIAALAAYAVASQDQRVYAGRSEIVLDLRNLGWDAAERILGTQLAVAESRAVLAPVAETLSVPVSDLERRLSAELIRNSSIVRLQYEDPNPSRALDITIAITERYTEVLERLLALQGDVRLQVLTAPFLLEEPVSPKPLRAAAIGAVVGMALAMIGIILWVQPWRTNHHA